MTLDPDGPGTKTTAVHPWLTLVNKAGKPLPALLIRGVVYVHYFHAAALSLARAHMGEEDLTEEGYGFVALDNAASVVGVRWSDD